MYRNKLFDNIRRGPLEVPSHMSNDALDLIVNLLNRSPTERLGGGPGDAEEIKQHGFFKSINWDEALQRKLRPSKPFIRRVKEAKELIEVFKHLEEESDLEHRMNKWTFISNGFK
jgi:serine/threonine protein kinase